MKAVIFRFLSIKNFHWIGIYVFRTFAIPPIYDFFPKILTAIVILNGSSYTALGVNVFSLNLDSVYGGQKDFSANRLVEHVLLKHFQRLVMSPFVRWYVPDCHVRKHFSNLSESSPEDNGNPERYHECRKHL